MLGRADRYRVADGAQPVGAHSPDRFCDSRRYRVADLTGDSGPAVSVYVSLKSNPKIVGIERHFDAKPRPARELRTEKIATQE